MIIFLGVAGSGKSVQSKLLAGQLNCPRLSTGEFLRQHTKPENYKAMLNGQMLDDDEVIEILDKVISSQPQNREFILDGSPRTLRQADWVIEQQSRGQFKVTAVIHLLASKETVHERLLERGRPDDHEAAINQRFKEYDEAIIPILQKFKQAGTQVHEIDGERSVQAINQDILNIFK